MYNNNPDQDREALHTEARLLQSVKHPNVVDVLCFVVEDGVLIGSQWNCLERASTSPPAKTI